VTAMENDWVSALSTGKLYLAEMARELLSEHGIESIIINRMDSVLLVGDVEVYVNSKSLVKAKYLLKDFED
jgi:hypothetical protein